MARTELTGLLRQIHAAFREARRTGVPADEIFARQREAGACQEPCADYGISRRRFLEQTGGAGLALSALGASAALASCGGKPAPVATHGPSVVIVGGGIAGVTCAYRLMQAGIASQIFDAGGGLGGRTWTLRNFFDQGQIVENGGEFISSEHMALRRLAAELGLVLDNLRAWDQVHRAEETYYVRGSRYPASEMLRDYAAVFPKLEKANAAAGDTRYNHYTMAGYAYDHLSARDWIALNVPGGIDSKMGRLLDLDATTENGGDSTQQNSLELIYMLTNLPALNPKGGFYLVGTDERYRVSGGNDLLITRMVAKLSSVSVHVGTRLMALRRRPDGSIACTFSNPSRTFDVRADHVVLALPFVTLRDCDLSRAEFSSVKMKAIAQLPMGTNTKLHVQFKRRVWLDAGGGATYSDTGYQQSWEDTRAQSGTAGVLVDYTGGTLGASFDTPSFAPAAPAVVNRFLSQIEPVLPGVRAQWNGKAFIDNWTKDHWHRGSYSYWGLGNCTAFVGIEPVRQGNVHFCGEHTSLQFGGFMNGAVETAEAAAAEVIQATAGAKAATVLHGSRYAV